MNLESLILFMLSTIGMCHVIVDGSVMEWFRIFVKWFTKKIGMPFIGGVVDCYLCCGTWCGFLMGYIWISNDPYKIFACGCAGGFLASFGAVLLNLIESMTMANLPSENNNES